jgi:hypothetical protein
MAPPTATATATKTTEKYTTVLMSPKAEEQEEEDAKFEIDSFSRGPNQLRGKQDFVSV